MAAGDTAGGDLPSNGGAVIDTLRLGWSVAEVRGRHWPQGPRPQATPLPLRPDLVLPLRSQRVVSASREESVASLVNLVHRLGLDRDATFESGLRSAVAPWADDTATGTGTPAAGDEAWRPTGTFFLQWDAWFQDELGRRAESLANGYLLGRGLAECFWGLGPDEQWQIDGATSAVSLPFLLGAERRRELTRMLGRLEPGVAHEMTPPAVAGTLEAWGVVAADPTWAAHHAMRTNLYEQARRWYQLLVLGQDPTTLIRPYERLRSPTNILRAVKIFWPQIALALLSIALVTAFFSVVGTAGDVGSVPVWFSSLLATGGFGAFAAAGILARGKSAAQRMVTRLRQDAYTDLVAVSVTTVPPPPTAPGGKAQRMRFARRLVEAAVRRRTLTPPTPPPT